MQQKIIITIKIGSAFLSAPAAANNLFATPLMTLSTQKEDTDVN